MPADPVTRVGADAPTAGADAPDTPDAPDAPGSAGAPRPGPAGAARGRHAADWVAVAVLVALPALLFTLPALSGHALMPGDDVDQNYPLRVLVGRDLRAGHWPALNPYIWSGTPLLAGWNAGAAYPATWLFAVLPPVAAWVVNEVLAYAVAGVGLYGFCRYQRLRPVAALLAALSFTLGGSYAVQLVHLGLVVGASWIPVMLLAVAKLADLSGPLPGAGRARWVAALGLAGGLCVLAGEPRSIDTAVVVLAGYALWRLVRAGSGRWAFAGSVALGGVLALLLGAVQWAPGLAAVGTSQRAASDYALFAAGSLRASWLALLAVPTLLGGSGGLGLPAYFASYNLPEVASYVGVLPLVAAVALLGRLRRRRQADPAAGRRRWPEWSVWHLLALVGIVLALGSYTPLGPLLHAVPFFGAQRLQSRNIMITDLALAVLLGYWAEHWLASRGRPGRAVRVLGLVTAAGVAALGVTGIVAGPALARALTVDAAQAGKAAELWPAFAASVGLAVAVAAVLWLGPRLGGRVRAGVLVGLVVADLAGYLAVAGAPSPLPPTGEIAATRPAPPPAPFDRVGRDGRFAVYSPNGGGSLRLGGIGITDLNVLSGRYSMQGYTAIVDGHYAEVTGTHLPSGGGHNTLSLAALADGTLDQLATKYLLTPTRYLDGGPLPDALTAGGWTFTGTLAGYAVFTNPHAAPALSLRALPGARLGDATVRRLTGDRLAPSSARVTSPAGAVVLRAAAAIPGWSARWQPDQGAARTLPVRRHGLVQAVTVPAGSGVLSWHYQAPGFATGALLSLLGVVLTAGTPAAAAILTRRRRTARRDSPPAG